MLPCSFCFGNSAHKEKTQVKVDPVSQTQKKNTVMQNAQVNQANQLIIDADKKLKSWWPFGGNKFEDALELYQKAANLYKMTKNCIV